MLKQLKRKGILALACVISIFPCLCVRLQNRTGHLIPAASQKQVLLWIWTPEPFFCPEYPCSGISCQHYQAFDCFGSSGKCLYG